MKEDIKRELNELRQALVKKAWEYGEYMFFKIITNELDIKSSHILKKNIPKEEKTQAFINVVKDALLQIDNQITILHSHKEENDIKNNKQPKTMKNNANNIQELTERLYEGYNKLNDDKVGLGKAKTMTGVANAILKATQMKIDLIKDFGLKEGSKHLK